MMIVFLLLAVIMAFLIGYLLVRCLWPDQKITIASVLLKFCLSIGTGIGICSCIYFVLLYSLPAIQRPLLIAVEVCVLLLLAALLYLGKDQGNYCLIEQICGVESIPGRRELQALGAIFCLIVGIAVAYFFAFTLENPHGTWDAWAHWNSHARFIYFAGGHWLENYAQGAHPDYPLLLPGFIARCWDYVGCNSISIPIMVAFIFTFATVGLLTAAVWTLSGPFGGLLSGIVLASTYWYIKLGSYQMADVPLAFYVLGVQVLFTFQALIGTQDTRLLILAGLLAGMAGWTKNEGLLLIACVILINLVYFIGRRRWRDGYQVIGSFCLGLLPVMAVILFFKLVVAPPSAYFAQSLGVLGSKIADPLRLQAVISLHLQVPWQYFRRQLFLLPALIVLFACIGRMPDRVVWRQLLILILFVVGCSAILLITQSDPQDQGALVLWRVYMQVWPAFLFILFVCLGSIHRQVSQPSPAGTGK